MSDLSLQRSQPEKPDPGSGRVPPGQVLTQKFPVLHYGPIPRVDLTKWDFRVWGKVEQPVTWTWDEFCSLPQTERTMDIHCVTRWSKLDTHWQGVSLKALVEKGLVRPLPAARFVIQHAEFGFTTNTPIEVALAENFLLATRYEGQPIAPEHGYPLRAIIGAIPVNPDLKTLYFWKGAKWLRGLEFSETDKPGFWEQAGYHNDGDVWLEQRIQ
jgi:DMSO/TMAO reductase YedYZ molybdopterin-dependent catalytic subunit